MNTNRKLRDVKTELATRNIAIAWSNDWGEYHIWPMEEYREGPSTYYTDDLDDAYHTGLKMRKA